MSTLQHKSKVWFEYLALVKYGDTIWDKIALLHYTLKTPFFPLMKKIGIQPSHTTYRDITLDIKGRIWQQGQDQHKIFCGKYISTITMASPGFEDFMKEELTIYDGTFIDVGANIGKYSLQNAGGCNFRLCNKFDDCSLAQVVAIEPEPDNFLKLRQSIILNGFQDIITALPIACGSPEHMQEGFADLHLSEPTQGSGIHSMKVKRPYFTQKTPIYTLDYIADNLKLKEIKLIKIDVEGAELDVLKGATKILTEHKPRIVFEAWHEAEALEIANYLKSFEYEVTPIKDGDGENYVALYKGGH